MNTSTHRVAELTVQLYRRDECEAHDGPYYYITITSVREERLATNVLPVILLFKIFCVLFFKSTDLI